MKCPECNKEITNETIEADIIFAKLARPKIVIVCKLPCGYVLNRLLDFSGTI